MVDGHDTQQPRKRARYGEESEDEPDRPKARLATYKSILTGNNGYSQHLGPLMYAFGDSEKPSPDSVAVLGDILMDFMFELCTIPPPPQPAPPLYLPIPSKQIPTLSITTLRRTLSRSPHHARKYAHLQEHIIRARNKRKAEQVDKEKQVSAKPGTLSGLGMGENMSDLIALAGEDEDGKKARGGGAKGGRGGGKVGTGGSYR